MTAHACHGCDRRADLDTVADRWLPFFASQVLGPPLLAYLCPDCAHRGLQLWLALNMRRQNLTSAIRDAH